MIDFCSTPRGSFQGLSFVVGPIGRLLRSLLLRHTSFVLLNLKPLNAAGVLGTRVQLLYAHPVTHAPCPYDNYHGGMPLLCSGPEKQPTGPISAICWLAAIPKRPEKNITATRHGSWQRGWLKQGSRGHAGDGDITASWYIYEQDEQKITTGSHRRDDRSRAR